MKSKFRTSLAIIAALCMANGILFAAASDKVTFMGRELSKAEAENIEKIMNTPRDKVICKNGGENTKSCNIEPGIKIGDVLTIECSVTCMDGFYACCGQRCICRPMPKK